MNSTPIVDRELRVASRKPSTFWWRVAAGLTAVIIGSGAFIISDLRQIRAGEVGTVLFYILTWVSMATALSAGLFLTSDCLSEEKREGTLGLLFLTELRGYDVVLGKLMATSLRAFYTLLAIFPVVAITQLMGGITGEQYWKSSLALLNGLFLSITTGVMVSAMSRDSQKALSATLLLLLLFTAGGPGADLLLAWARKHTFEPFWSAASPAYALAAASAWGRPAYWQANVVCQLAGWTMLGLAAVLVPRAWQDRKRGALNSFRGWSYAWKYGSARRRGILRRRWLEKLPLAWLTYRERWQSLGIWAVAVLVAGVFATVLISSPNTESWILWNYVGGAFLLVLYVWAASQACRFFVEARRGGMLELLLATPMSERDIVRGQWRGISRTFALPVLVLLVMHATAATLSQISFQALAAQVGAATVMATTNQAVVATSTTTLSGGTMTVTVSGTTNATPSPARVPEVSGAQQTLMAAGTTAAAAFSTAANLLALCWFGMWMGMTSRTANLATLKTLLFVQVIPWLVIAFASNIVVGAVLWRSSMRSAPQPSTWLTWWPFLTASLNATCAIGKDVGFIVWSRAKLYSSLREQAAQGFGPPRTTSAPLLQCSHSRTGRAAAAPAVAPP
jgi:hypothetical protein